MRTLKWIYKLGYDQARNSILREIERSRDFEQYQMQIKTEQQPDDPTTKFGYKTTPKQHKDRRRALEDLLNTLDPEKYPNIDRFMDLMA